MKTRRYLEAQIFRVLQEVDAGYPVVDAARKHGVSPATIHRWKARYGGMTLSELKHLKALEEENPRLNSFGSWVCSYSRMLIRPSRCFWLMFILLTP